MAEVMGRAVEMGVEVDRTGDPALTTASNPMELSLSGDGGLTELCQVQWGLIREQISNISRELGALRQDINTLRFADSQSELQQNELSRHMREMQASFRRDLAAEGSQRQQLESHFEASVREITEIELSKLTAALDSQRGEVTIIEKRVQQSIIELERVLQDAKRELHARAGSTEEAFSKRAIGDAETFNDLRRQLELAHSKHEERSATEVILKKELQKLNEALENQEKLHSSSMSSLQNTVRTQQQKAIDASIEPLRQSFSEFASNSKGDMALLADAHKKLHSLHSVAETGRSSDSERAAAALEAMERNLLEQLEARLSSHADEHSKRTDDLRDLLQSISSREESERESHKSGMQSSMEELASSLKSELAAHGAGLEAHRGHFQESMTSSGDRFTKRFEELESKFRDQLETLTEKHGERHTDFEQRLSLHKTELQRSRTQQLEAHDEHSGSMQTALGELAESLKKDLENHVGNLTQKHTDLDQRLAKHGNDRQMSHSELTDRLVDVERRLQDALSQLAADHDEHRTTMTNSVEVLERELLEKLTGHADEHHSRHSDMKGSLARVAQDHYDKFGELHAMQQQHADQHKAAHQEHKDATFSALESIEERVRSHLDSHRADSNEAHGNAREAMEELDRKLKEAMSQMELKHSRMEEMHRKHKDSISQLSLDHETKHSTAKSTLSGLEQKLRDELAAVTTEHHSKHSDVRDQLAKHASDSFAKHAEIKDHVSKTAMSVQERMREEHQGALAALEAKLKRDLVEHKAGWETHHSSVRDTLAKERQDREHLHGGVVSRIEEVDKRVKEAMSRLVEDHEGKHTQMHSTLGSLERRLREELDQVQGAAQSDRHSQQAQLRDQVARACSELRAELQDIVTKVSVQDKSARDEYRNSLMMAVESLETRLRREMSNHKAGHEETFENMFQDRKTLERSFALITDRLAELEARLSAEFSQAAITRDASGNELREVIEAALIREREQADQRANAMSLQISTLQDQVRRQLEQERAGREVHQESLRVYLTQDRAAREDALRILQERLEKAESTFSVQMGDHVSFMVPRQEFEQAMELSISRQEMEQSLKGVLEVAEKLSSKITILEKEMSMMLDSSPKPQAATAATISLPAPEQAVVIQALPASIPGSLTAPPPSPAPAVEPEQAPVQLSPAPTPPMPITVTQTTQLPPRVVRPMAQRAVSPMRQILLPVDRRSFSPMACSRVTSITTSPATAVAVGPPRVRSTAGAMEKARTVSMDKVPTATVGIDTTHDGRANIFVTGVDRNRDGIPDLLQQMPQDAPLASATVTGDVLQGPMQVASTPVVGVRSFEASPMATVDVKLGDEARATVTGIDRNHDGIPDVLQQGQTVITTAARSFSPAPTVRPTRVMPPEVSSGSFRQEFGDTVLLPTAGGRNGAMKSATKSESATEYSAVSAERAEEVDEYVCGPAQFQGKPASMASIGVAATPPRGARQAP